MRIGESLGVEAQRKVGTLGAGPQSSGLPPPVLSAHQISRSVTQGDAPLEILHKVDVSLAQGEILCLMGPSGSGKSSLLQILGLLDAPSAGEVFIEGERVDFSRESALIRLRRRKIGFLFQNHNLLPGLTAVDNVALPLILLGLNRREAEERAHELLERVGLAHRANFKAVKLSGGESQRVALARALVHKPAILIADEPTGSLDRHNGEIVLDLLRAHTAASHSDGGHGANHSPAAASSTAALSTTASSITASPITVPSITASSIAAPTAVIVATHSEEVQAIAHRTIYLRDGYLQNSAEIRNPLRDGRQFIASNQVIAPAQFIAPGQFVDSGQEDPTK